MNQNVDYDYDEVIQYCQGEGQNSINELANSLNALSNEWNLAKMLFTQKVIKWLLEKFMTHFLLLLAQLLRIMEYLD